MRETPFHAGRLPAAGEPLQVETRHGGGDRGRRPVHSRFLGLHPRRLKTGLPRRELLSVVIPARNEAGRIASALRAVDGVLSRTGYRYELIVVDDGSEDGTGEVARAVALPTPVRLVVHPRPTGKGGTVASGFRASRGSYVAFIDADLEFPAAALGPMLRAVLASPDPLHTCAIAVRTRDCRSVPERLSSRLARLVIRRLFGLRIRDTQAGLKLFPGWLARRVLSAPKDPGWTFDIESLLLARDHGVQIREIPVVQTPVRRRRAGSCDLLVCGARIASLAVHRWSQAWLPAGGPRWAGARVHPVPTPVGADSRARR